MEVNHILKVLQFSRFFWIVLSLLFILNLTFYGSFVRGQRDRIDELQSLYSEKRGLRAENTSGELRNYLQANKTLKLFREKLPVKSGFAEKVGELNALLDRPGLAVSKVTFKPEELKSMSLWKYATAFSVIGSYSILKMLLADIQNSKSLFCIESLSLMEDSGQVGLVEMKLKIATYFR